MAERKPEKIKYIIDVIRMEDHMIEVNGWGYALYGDRENGQPDIRPLSWTVSDGKGQKLEVTASRKYRADALRTLTDQPCDTEVGFQIIWKSTDSLRYEICFSDQNRAEKQKYVLNIQDLELIRREEALHFEGIPEMLRHMNRTMLGDDVRFVLRRGPREYYRMLKKRCARKTAPEYKKWRKQHSPSAAQLERQRNNDFLFRPKISIVVPVYRTPKTYLNELIASVRRQTYADWQLCLADGSGPEDGGKTAALLKKWAKKDARIQVKILPENLGIAGNTNEAMAMADGDYVALADHDDLLAPDALYEVVAAMQQDTPEILYSDEDKVSMDSKIYFEPNFKPDFSMDYLCSVNYICHLFVFRRDFFDRFGGFRTEYDGAQDHDLILRYTEQAERIRHIPKILYHWRSHLKSTAENPESKLYAFDNGAKAVEAHWKRVGIPATVTRTEFYGIYRTAYHWDRQPHISILVPNKDHAQDLKRCIDSVEQKSAYRNFEWIIIENNSTETETFSLYRELEKRGNIRIVTYQGGFNYSRINNFGVSCAGGEYLLFLNNDTELISPDSLSEMVSVCMRPEVGAVGAKLLYPDSSIQHAGVIVGFGGIAGHAFAGQPGEFPGYCGRIASVQDYSAVTAACMMCSKEDFLSAGGFTGQLEVAFNDIDFCLKLREQKKHIIYDPYAVFYHYESKTRGAEDSPEKLKRFRGEVEYFEKNWKDILENGDPFYNPNLSLHRPDFTLSS